MSVKQNIPQPSAAAGEIAPELYGRVDQELYYIGLRTCRNAIVRQYGGISNRPGTKFVAEVKEHDKKVRLIPFTFNEQQTYVLGFGDEYMRVIKDGGEVLESAKTITGASKTNPVVITAPSHGYSNGDQVYVYGVAGMVEVNGRVYQVKNATTNSFEIADFFDVGVNGESFSTYSGGGNSARVYTLATPYTESDLFGMNYAQSNDVLTVVHPDHYPRDITRTADDSFTISELGNSDGPFKDINATSTTVYASGLTGSVTLTSSAPIFTASMIGDLFYIEQEPNDSTPRWEVAKSIASGDIVRSGSNYYEAQNTAHTGTVRPDHTVGSATDGNNAVEWLYLHSGFGIVEITGYTSATQVSATVIKRLPDNVVGSGNATEIWACAAWSETEGFPQAVAYNKQRLIFAGTPKQSSTLWFSKAGNRKKFSRNVPLLDDDAIVISLDSTEANAIRHLVPLKQLIVLTAATEQVVDGGQGLLLATEPPGADVQGKTGASKRVPIIINNTAIFVQDLGATLRTLQYTNDSGGFSGIDLSARSPHLFQGREIVDWAYARHPLSIIWCVLDNGALVGLTFMQEQQVYAWHRHDTDGFYESVCCIREGNETATYLVVRRNVDGREVRYIERMASRYFTDVRDAFFVDCGLTYDGRNKGATTISISGGTEWDSLEELTLTASSAMFSLADVGDQIVFWDGKKAIRLNITQYVSATSVKAIPTKSVPLAYRNTARKDWEFARTTLNNLDHLEGKKVAILADGNEVVGKTVVNGKIELDEAAAVAHVGLAYTTDIETLDIVRMANPGDLKGKTFAVPNVTLDVMETRSLYVGTNGFDDLIEYRQRTESDGYDSPIQTKTGTIDINTSSRFSKNGRVCIRQTSPLPLSITGITPEVKIGAS